MKAGVAIVALLVVAVVLATWIIARNLGGARQAKALLAGDQQYRALADEYRRLSDLAITAQEHTDLKLADLRVQMDYLRSQNEALQSILKEVD